MDRLDRKDDGSETVNVLETVFPRPIRDREALGEGTIGVRRGAIQVLAGALRQNVGAIME
jgi:hypothetical protein